MKQNKTTLPLLFGIMVLVVIGSSSYVFAEEDEEFVTVDIEKVVKPQSVSKYEEITILGHVNDYSRGYSVFLTIVNPDGTQDEISTYASKKGDVYTLLHLTEKSQVGKYEIILMYDDVKRASTSFELIEYQQ